MRQAAKISERSTERLAQEAAAKLCCHEVEQCKLGFLGEASRENRTVDSFETRALSSKFRPHVVAPEPIGYRVSFPL